MCVLPVELVDVLYVAEQSADLLRFQRQSATVDDTAKIILQTHRETHDEVRQGWNMIFDERFHFK